MFEDNPQRVMESHGKYAFYCSCFCFSEHARGRGYYKASSLGPERQWISLRGRIMPELQVHKVCKPCTELATLSESRSLRSQRL